MSARFACEEPGKLLAIYKIPTGQFQSLRIATMAILGRSLSEKRVFSEAEELLEAFEAGIDSVTNMTPNGKIMPKPHLELEYNIFIRCIADIIQSMDIEAVVSSVRLPTLRYKAGTLYGGGGSERHYATEKPHLETWVGHSQDSIAFHIPVLGDLKNNHLQLFSPPEDFEESWADPISDFNHGAAVAESYIRHDIIPQAGFAYIFECTSLHASVQTHAKTKARVSLEVTCLMKEKIQRPGIESNAPAVKLDSDFTIDELKQIGNQKFLRLLESMSGLMEAKDFIDM